MSGKGSTKTTTTRKYGEASSIEKKYVLKMSDEIFIAKLTLKSVTLHTVHAPSPVSKLRDTRGPHQKMVRNMAAK
jgi:hypothetical protein